MLTAPVLQKRSARLLLIFIGWTIVGLFLSSRYIMIAANMPTPIPLAQQFLPLVDAYIWALLTPAILYFTRKFPFFEKRSRDVAIHFLLSLIFAVAQSALYVVTSDFLPIPAYGNETLAERLVGGVLRNIHNGVLTYAVIVFVVLAINYYHRFREGELRASKLRSQLSEAQLQALKMQLHPHFLFNTLHAVSTLIHKDPEAADQMIARLSDLLRLVLENPARQKVKLSEEIALLEKYLHIEQVRFQDRLRIERDVAESALAAEVPNLILQPLVENAIRHGVSKKSGAGVVRLSAEKINGQLQLGVSDNGPGLQNDASEKIREGVGLQNTKARLEQLYGEKFSFELLEAAGGGLDIRIKIPYENSNNHR